MAVKIRKGDTVQVLTGKSKGVRGTVLSVHRSRNRVVVERVNMIKRHQKPSAQHRQGGIIEKEASIHLSNVALVQNGEPTRVGFRVVDGEKVRWALKNDEAIDG